MNRVHKRFIIVAALLLLVSGAFYSVLAEQHRHGGNRECQRDSGRDGHGHHQRGRKHYEHRKFCLPPVNNETYKEECGACHFAYQPGLLPSGSWKKILEGLDEHFDDSIELDPDSKKIIAQYLETNAAEYSGAKRAIKIMRSLGNQTPIRITDVPCIKRKHRKIPPGVLDKESIGSLSNCSACHTRAEQGIYDDDYVVIPP